MLLFQICLLVTAPMVASGFNVFQPLQHEIKPDLFEVTDQQADKKLKIQLHLGQEYEAQMAIKDMMIELHHEAADYERVALPGADGPHKKVSSGPRRLDLISEGSYVNLMGTQHVKTEKGCWEICWVKGKPAGTLVCGFEVPQDYMRNEATLRKGRLFLSFPIWTASGLKTGQAEKRKVEARCEHLLEQHEEALYQADLTDNPIMKAFHLQSADAAAERYDLQPHETLELIPEDHQVMKLQDDLLLTTGGIIWSKEGSFFEGGDHTQLGYATILPGKKRANRLMP